MASKLGAQVDVADTVGCGDSFTAAAALGWLAAAELRTLLTLCNAVGAATATSVGAGRQVQVLSQLHGICRLLLHWSGLAKNRESWRDKIRQILGHTQPIGNV